MDERAAARIRAAIKDETAGQRHRRMTREQRAADRFVQAYVALLDTVTDLSSSDLVALADARAVVERYLPGNAGSGV